MPPGLVTLGARSLPPLISSGLILALALALLVRRGELPLRRWFAAQAICSAAWSFCQAILLGAHEPSIARRATQASFALLALLGPIGLWLAAALVRARPRGRVLALALGAIGAALVLALPSWSVVAARPGGAGYWPRPSPVLLLAGLSTFLPLGYALVVVARVWHRLPPSRARRQVAWAGAAMLFGTLGAIDLHTLWTRGYPVAWATTGLSALLLSYAIAQQRLMATRTFVRQLAISVLGVCVAALALATLGLVAGPLVSSPLVLAVATIILFAGVRLWAGVVEPGLAYLFGWRRRRIEYAWTEFERRSLEARSTDEVAQALGAALQSAFDARLVCVLPADRQRAADPPALGHAEALLAESGEPVLRDLLDLDDAEAPRLRQALDELGADALVPLRRDKQLQAIAAIAGGALLPADDALAGELDRLGARAALAWVNATLYSEVERRSTGLEAQVRLRTIELEEALAELKNAQARLLEAERSSSLGLLVAGISHEINNALNIMHANLPTLARYAQRYEELLLEAQLLDGAVIVPTELASARALLPHAIAQLGEATRRTRGIVDDLRKFARPDTERRLVRVQEGLDAALNLLRRRTDGRLDVARVYAGTPGIDGYPGPLNQCFFNLLLNAVEAARSEIWIILRPHGDEGGVELIISDDGDGISPLDQEHIFQPFFTTKAKAAGLGLTVSRSIVERHGGTLAVVSQAGQGATVRLRLPARAPEPDVARGVS